MPLLRTEPASLGQQTLPYLLPHSQIERTSPSSCRRTTFGSGTDLAAQLLPSVELWSYLFCPLIKRSEVSLTEISSRE